MVALAQAKGRWSWDWLGLVPFMAFITAFLLFPAFYIILGTFTTASGAFTLSNISEMLGLEFARQSYLSSIQISLSTAIGGGIIGFLVSWAITVGGLPQWVRGAVLSFCGVAANFAGVPLVFAFLAALGRLGIVTNTLKDIGIKLYPGFSLPSALGLSLIYIYFQIPLMVLIIVPALDGLRKDWSEAAENLGASRFQYWRYVALPILLPSILGTLALLFGNAFGAHATAFALLGGGVGSNMVITILVGSQFSSDTFSNPAMGYTLAFGMIVVIAVTISIYAYFRRLSERWMKK